MIQSQRHSITSVGDVKKLQVVYFKSKQLPVQSDKPYHLL